MQIFVSITLHSVVIGWAMVYLLGPPSSHAQVAMELLDAGKVATGQANNEIGQTVEGSPTEALEAAALNARRPLPTSSNLLPSPAVFTRQPAVPEQLIENARSRRQQATTDVPNTMPAREPGSAAFDNGDEKEVFRMTNEAREAAGLPALQWDENLAKAARHHAVDMDADGYFDHDTYDRINGQLVRICSAQERMGLFSPRAAGENIAKGQPTAEQVMLTWLASPPHRKGILRADITSVGVGKAGRHWVQNFGW